MKKLIITIFIIFAYGIPQVFAVPPALYRTLIWLPGYINSYALYVQTNQIKWYIPNNAAIVVKHGTMTMTIPLKGFIEEALREWQAGFTKRPITFVYTTNINEATIRFTVNNTVETNSLLALAAPRGFFPNSQGFGQITFFQKVFSSNINDENRAKLMRDAIGQPNMTDTEFLRYMIRATIKHEPGHLFGLGHNTPWIPHNGTNPIPPVVTETTLNATDLTNDVTRVFLLNLRPLRQNEPVSIMYTGLSNYFQDLQNQLGRPVNFEDITVTVADRGMVQEITACTRDGNPNLIHIGYSFKLNCNIAEINTIVTSYLSNNTAVTTALRRGEL